MRMRTRAASVPSGWTVLLAAFLAGCSTVGVEHRAVPEIRREIKGSEKFDLTVQNLDPAVLGDRAEFRIVPQKIIRNYKREVWRKEWDDVTRQRYLTSVFHADYATDDRFGMELVESALAPIMPIAGAFMAEDAGGDLGMGFWAGVLSVLPFISLESPLPTTEVTKEHYGERKIDPAEYHDVETTKPWLLDGKRICWEVTDPQGAARGRGKVSWPDPIPLPWTDWALDRPENPFWVMNLTSPDVNLRGNLQYQLPVDLKDVVRRKWPDPHSRPVPTLKIGRVQLLDDQKKPLDVLPTGRKVRLNLKVETSLFSDPTYLPEIVVKSNLGTNLVAWPATPARRWLGAHAAAEWDADLLVRLSAAEGKARLVVEIRDAFGRTVADAAIERAIRRSSVPRLLVHMPAIRRDADRRTGRLEFALRNVGEGAAHQVVLDVASPNLQFAERSATMACIASGERPLVVLPLSAMPAAGTVVPVRFTVKHDLIGSPPTVLDVDVVAE